MTEVLAPTTADRQPQQPSSVVLKHLVWKDVRTFGLPALVFVAAYFLMTLAAYIFSPNEIDFGKVANAILIFTSYGLAMLWATAAGAIVTASDREDGTDTWMRSLPVASWSVFLCRVLVAYLSVVVIGVSCAIGLIWCVKCGPEGCVPIMLSDDPFLAARAAGFFSMAAAFLASGLLMGTVVGRVMAAVLLGAMLPIVVGMVAAMADFPAATEKAQQAAEIATLVVLGLLVVAAIAFSGCFYARGVYPQWSPARTTGAGPWRRKLANRVSPTRRLRSLVSRELHALARFLPIAAVYLLLTLYIREPVGWYVVVMFVPWAAGLALAGTDGRDDTLPFLTHRGLPGSFVWVVKNVVWGASLAALMVVFLVIVEQVVIAPYPDGTKSWQLGVDQGIRDGQAAPTSVMSTIYASMESRLTNSSYASIPKRRFVIASAATLAITLFLLGQISGFWCRRKVIAMAVSLVVCIPWMFLHTMTAAFETPGWAVNAVPLAILSIFALRACIDAVSQRSPWLKRGVIGGVMLCVFVLCVRNSRLHAVPDPVGGLTVQPVSKSAESTAEASLLFNELASVMRRPVSLPAGYPVQLGSGGSKRGGVRDSLAAWVASPNSTQFFYQNDSDEPPDEATTSSFESRVATLKRFADVAASGSRMPSGTSFAAFNVVDGIAVTLLVDATLKWDGGDEVRGWESWTNAWIVADYFATHDGEWTHTNEDYQVSPTGKIYADATRLLCLNVLLNRLRLSQISEPIKSEVYEVVIQREPKPRRELANAAYRVLIDDEPDAGLAKQSFGLQLLDFYLGGSASQSRAGQISVALLQHYADYGEQRGVRLADIAAQYGLSLMDVKRLETSSNFAEFRPGRPSISPFVRAVDEAERNVGHRHSDLMLRYQDALRELERRGGVRDVVEAEKGVETISASSEK